MDTNFARSIRTALKGNATIYARVAERIFRAAIEERLSNFQSFQKPFIMVSVSIGRSDTNVPDHDVTLRILYVESPDISTPHEVCETYLALIVGLFDRKPQTISDAGYGVRCRHCVKESTEVYFDPDLDGYLAAATFSCIAESSHLVSAEATRKNW